MSRSADAKQGENTGAQPENRQVNRQVQRTRSWIFEALMLLLDEKPYDKISISDITNKAGIARQTFYRNYDGKDDILLAYLSSTLSFESLKVGDGKEEGRQNTIVLSFRYRYMLENRDRLKKVMAIAEVEQRIYRDAQNFPLALLEQYRKEISTEEYVICRYKLCFQITGCLRVFFDWFVNDMPMSFPSLVEMMNAMNTPKVVRFRNIPNILVRIAEE